jgi:uncharacterized membrane protein
MPSKYDTNPLDPEFPEKAKAAAAAQETRTLPYEHQTNGFGPAPSEDATRRFAPVDTASYSPPFNGQYVPGPYQPGAFMGADRSLTRKVDKVGIAENIMVALPYFPFWIGLVAAVLELLFVPRHETKVRFHAAQGLAAHAGILIVTSILGIVGEFARGANVGSAIFTVAATVMLIIWAVKAWKGKPVHIESIEGLTNWFEEKIKLKS